MSAQEFFKPEDFTLSQIANHSCGDIAKHCNRLLLERGQRVWGSNGEGVPEVKPLFWGPKWMDGEIRHNKKNNTHTALLINIEPIAEDSAESLLKEFINACDGNWYERFESLNARARKLLEAK